MSFRNHLLFIWILIFGFCQGNSQKASSLSLGNMYIPQNGSIGIFSDHNFVNIDNGLLSGIIATDRTENNFGKVLFANNSSWSNASAHSFIDGYTGASVDGAFLLPTGDNDIYAPVGLSNAHGIVAAYYAANPSIGVTSKVLSEENTLEPINGPYFSHLMSKELSGISEHEYWDIQGEGATHITLSWDEHSKIEDLVKSDLRKLTIVGWDGFQWVRIPSSIDEFIVDKHVSYNVKSDFTPGLTEGSISTDFAIKPNEYSSFTLGALFTDDDGNNHNLVLFPNPVSSSSNLVLAFELNNTDNGQLFIHNGSNKLVYSEKLEKRNDKVLIPMSQIGKGVFNVTISGLNGKTAYKRLIVVDN